MSEFNCFLGELASPFPAQILKNELKAEGLRYRSELVPSGDPALKKELFYVHHNDSSKAIELMKRVEYRDGESNIKYEHRFIKFLKQLGPILVGIWVIWKIYSFIIEL